MADQRCSDRGPWILIIAAMVERIAQDFHFSLASRCTYSGIPFTTSWGLPLHGRSGIEGIETQNQQSRRLRCL